MQAIKQNFSDITPKVSDKFDVGVILISEWGYEQTKVYYYLIVALTDKFVSVIPMNKKVEYDNSGNRIVVPDIINFNFLKKYGIIQKKIKYQKIDNVNQPYVSINSFENAFLWTGKPNEEDSYIR